MKNLWAWDEKAEEQGVVVEHHQLVVSCVKEEASDDMLTVGEGEKDEVLRKLHAESRRWRKGRPRN